MSREQAETYLRQLAESELRQLRSADSDRPGRYGHAPKLLLAAQALAAVGAIDAGTAWRIRADADFALAARQPRPSQPPSPAARRLHRSLPVQPPPAVGQALPAAGPARALAARSVPWRVVSVGRVIPGAAPNGDVTVLAYLEGPAGARFAITGGIPGFPGQLTATDDRGANYHLRLMRGPRTGVLELLPGPAHPIRRLDVLTASGGIAARFDLDSVDQHPADQHSADRGRPRPEVTMARTATSPGELMLDVIAARILAAAPVPSAGPGPVTASPDLRAFIGSKPGDITAAMLAAGALSPASALPGQLAGLCERLGIPGHGITAPPAAVLPAPWESMLAYRGELPALAPGRWAMTAEPRLGATQLTILGLDHAVAGTVLHTLVSGARPDDDWEFSRGTRPLQALWVRDSSGDWHATRTSGILPWNEAGLVMQSSAIIPPLPAGTAWIDVFAAVPAAEARVRLPLHGPQIRPGPAADRTRAS
jgi:hypothetical protein